MKVFSTDPRKALGSLLVGLQFACMLVLPVLAAPALLRGGLAPLALVLLAAALALLLWTLVHNRLGNFNIRPIPKPLGTLVTSGPYRWIRHPMYSAVLLGAAAMACLAQTLPAWSVCAFLALVLYLKSVLEERWMRAQHLQYAAYCAHSKRFVPLIF
jgi:protein-S-isoprenylcysteine O-methyltransferase Ste14